MIGVIGVIGVIGEASVGFIKGRPEVTRNTARLSQLSIIVHRQTDYRGRPREKGKQGMDFRTLPYVICQPFRVFC